MRQACPSAPGICDWRANKDSLQLRQSRTEGSDEQMVALEVLGKIEINLLISGNGLGEGLAPLRLDTEGAQGWGGAVCIDIGARGQRAITGRREAGEVVEKLSF